MNTPIARQFRVDSQHILDRIFPCLLPIQWVARPDASLERGVQNTQGATHGFATGFRAVYKGIHYWITAGHVLKPLQEAFKAGKIVKARFCDGLDDGGIVLDLNSNIVLAIDDEASGIDVGIIILTEHWLRLLDRGASKSVEVSEQSDGLQYDIYALAGFPGFAQSRQKYRSHNDWLMQIEAGTPLWPMERLRRRPKGFNKTTSARMYFRLLVKSTVLDGKTLPISSVVEMSGGPVFGFRRLKDGWEFELVGVQSAEKSTGGSLHLAACPIARELIWLAERVHEQAAARRDHPSAPVE